MKTLSASILFLPFAVIAADTNALPPLLPAYPEITRTFWEQYQVLVLIGGFGLLVFFGLGLWFLFKPRPPVVQSPATIAREALKKLQQQPEDGRILSEVSKIFRRYAGAVFGYPGVEMTTAELSTALAADAKAGPQVAEALATFLRACDENKFAGRKDAPALDAANRALQLVEEIETRRKELPASKPIPK